MTFSSLRDRLVEYRRRRSIYLRTLAELQSYRPHELLDLGIDPGEIDELARRQAGL